MINDPLLFSDEITPPPPSEVEADYITQLVEEAMTAYMNRWAEERLALAIQKALDIVTAQFEERLSNLEQDAAWRGRKGR